MRREILFSTSVAFLIGVICAAQAPARAAARADILSPVSRNSPFAACTADRAPHQPGQYYPSSQVEPWIAVNPVNPMNVVGIWQQDRWNNGGARGPVTGVSFDGGLTWEQVVIPGVSKCGGGSYQRASDPWISFAPNGDLHQIALVFNTGTWARNGMIASRSSDGGLTWSDPVTLATGTTMSFHDKESITADPTDANYVYAVWDLLDRALWTGAAIFTRSADGGATWGPAQTLHDPGPLNQTIGNQVVVTPDGTVFAFFNEIFNTVYGTRVFFSFKRSSDKGATWVPASGAFQAFEVVPQRAYAPDRRYPVRDGMYLFDVAVDPRNGYLYVVWQDGDLTRIGIPAVGFSMSKDGGATWSAPIIVNRTPADLPFFSRQAFLPSVHVAESGIVGVSYYDFRSDTPEPGAPTDHWFVWCHPLAADCTNPDRWSEEIRLTDDSFDILQAPIANGLFLGDYVGLGSAGGDFIALFTQPYEDDPSSAFTRRVLFDASLEPGGLGFWKHQTLSRLSGRGRAVETEETLLGYLAEIREIHDLFDDVAGLDGLASVLAPQTGASMRARARAHLMALLLNLVSGRLSAWAEIGGGQYAGGAAGRIAAVVADAASTQGQLEDAKDLAEAVNGGEFPINEVW